MDYELMVDKAIENVSNKNNSPIIRHFDGYIILAQSEDDFEGKKSKIIRGDRRGFYTIERAIKLK